MSLNTQQLAEQIAAAMESTLAAQWPYVATLATGEALKLATTLVSIDELSSSKQLDSDTASLLLDMQHHASRAVILSLGGISLIIAEEAINAGLKVVASAVNVAVGFPLL